MADRSTVTLDGNQAASDVAFRTNEVISIYPITPSSPMGEHADAWAAQGQTNIWGSIPTVIEMQSEGGASGTCHGSLQGGALTATFTASQGLLLMIPNLFKIAGELSSSVFHIAARSVATHALSIFAEHSDVMACRGTGWGMLASGSVQEAHDMALISQMATLETRVPFLHFFDGFRTSHEINKITRITDEEIRDLIDEELVRACRDRAMNPDKPVLRGSAQNPDVFFQARESCNPFYLAAPSITQKCMDRFAERTGRRYNNFDYVGAPDAERVIVLMASSLGAGNEAIERLLAEDEKVGMLIVRLYRPFDTKGFVNVLPKTIKTLVALDRTKEPGSVGEPLFTDVVAALFEEWRIAKGTETLPRVIGGRYGLSSKEFTPAMFKAVLDEAQKAEPKRHFTVGIHDDVTQLSLAWDPSWSTESAEVTRGVFWGLGSDGTVGASKNSVKIIAGNTPMYAQGYFVYDSKKAGSVTISHLRFGPKPINSTYLIDRANFVSCSQFNFLERMDVLGTAEPGATFLLNSPYGVDEVWSKIPVETQQQIIDKKLKFFVVDAGKVAEDAHLGARINTVMQTAFFQLSGILPQDEAIAQIKKAIEKSYAKRGQTVVDRNFAAVDGTVAGLAEVKVHERADGDLVRASFAVDDAPAYVRDVTSKLIAGLGETLPVSAFAPDGSFPTGTTKYEKRSVARDIPIWDPKVCIDCAVCSLVCPHAAIRMKVFTEADIKDAPEGFAHKIWKGRDQPEGTLMTIQVAPDDCTGCGVCVDSCLGRNKEVAGKKSINMEYKLDHLDRERKNWDFFLSLPEFDRTKVKMGQTASNQLLESTFEFSGACAGCGETPYVKLVSQLFGERMLVANATGCSSIYGGNLPTTPWTTTRSGRGPTWNNSLFEDNAEFGLGMRLAIDAQRTQAESFLKLLAADLGDDLVTALIESTQTNETEYAQQRERVVALKQKLAGSTKREAASLLAVADSLVDRSVWIMGGDGWAYDIGFGGLDHVLASGRDVNCLVLDTQVYSNTGGQASKATPRGAVAKFAASGKPTDKKDLGMIAMAYGNVYVAQIALGANQRQTINAILEAEAYPGPSLIIAYSPCIAHGIDMTLSQSHMKEAVKSGFWPLYRFSPQHDAEG
ncbi:MAG: pyruvate:ferredoxin (flavodoxin) oxidoreductase, partial [Deltaproteobacteria bacterium]|nr:pyruvate:ferredoxin (flavodoxin) oxidoreductase [Deltaproteobacteria bacterium]